MKPADVPLPRRMRALQRDGRGYPVPFIVQRDARGLPVFAANDARRVLRCIAERRCGICGNRLEKRFWFAGGPLAALHAHGAYLDNAMHYECAEYALRVCPYLALKNFAHGDGIVNAAVQRLSSGTGLVEDHTMLNYRPVLFVAVCADNFTCTRQSDITFAMRPKRPYLGMEFWQHGVRLSHTEGLLMAEQCLKEAQLTQ